jgi:hypothetical protein
MTEFITLELVSKQAEKIIVHKSEIKSVRLFDNLIFVKFADTDKLIQVKNVSFETLQVFLLSIN